MLENGRLKIIHVFRDDHDETFFIGKGLYKYILFAFKNLFISVLEMFLSLGIKEIHLSSL